MERQEPASVDAVRNSGEAREGPRADPALVRAVSDWLQQLARTIKTCRLYDAGNPTVVAMRRDLAASLAGLLEEHGAFEIGFTPEAMFLGETPLYAARSREDNLSLPFFRDGIRSLTLQRGIEPREVDALVDCLLAVMRMASDDTDLVTLLWERQLDHLVIQYVSLEGDIESGGDTPLEGAEEAATGTIAPFPRNSPAFSSAPDPGAALEDGGGVDDTGRSDDRITAGRAREIEAQLLGMQIAADAEVARLLREYEAECSVPLARKALQLISACFAHAGDSDRRELRQFLPRLLHDALSEGDWHEARECLYLMRTPAGEPDAIAAFAADIARPDSLTSRNAWRSLECQSAERQESFFELARELGPEGADWLMRGIAESQRQGLRRRLARMLAEIVKGNPERLAPWLADERWYVVRNVVHILGLMEDVAPIGLLRSVASHPEYRVRREVVAVLGRVPRESARPILLEMLGRADSRLFGAVVHQLAQVRDPGLAAMLVEMIENDAFPSRPEEERRIIYQGLAAAGGDDAVPLLEAHAMQGNWLARGDETSRLAAVMCLARIGTPAARRILETGAKSRRGEVARACRAGLATMKPVEGDTNHDAR